MSAMLKTKFVVNFYNWMTFICLACAAEAEVYSSAFYRVTQPNYVIINTLTSYKAISIIECAVKCLNENCICYSFNKQQQQCTMGTCKATNTSTGNSGDFYVTCNTKAGFKLFTSGPVTACVWMSSNAVDYFNARTDCLDKGANLYTIKSLEKLKILQDNFAGKVLWVGLDDVEEEGVYRWEDDNTICSGDLVRQIFAPGEPNDRNGVDNCVHINPNDLLNDIHCSVPLRYICEQPFFNSF